MDVLKGNPKSTVCHPFYKEESKKYFVNYELFDEWQWLSDGRVIIVSEKGGYTQAYLYSSQGIEQRLLTPEERDITKVYGYDEKSQVLYYQAANTPMTRQAYAMNVKKNTSTQLTKGEGTHDLHFAKDFTRYIHCYHSIEKPHTYTLYEVKGDRLELKGTILSNDSVLQAWQALGVNEKEFFTITTERGDVLNAWRILPKDFDPSKKYPVVMLQYSGPTSQRVLNNWRKRFGYALADAGYLVVNVDGRGTGARGRAWRNATYMQLGVKEAEDQISAAQYLQSLPYVDGDRIAICGWSYGGYQTLMCLSKQNNQSPMFKCGIAIAPVTNWRLYDSAYTERFMRRPQVNEFGYEGTDLMQMAGNLTGELLIVHGLADDNVHAQNTLLYTDALVQAGKQFEMQLYVDDNHSIRKPANNEHLHKRIMLFLEKNL
jgi:dipeptidyl-peptidase-4